MRHTPIMFSDHNNGVKFMAIKRNVNVFT